MNPTPDTTPQVTVTETMVTPTGLDPINDTYETQSFGVFVRWQGGLGWTVTRMNTEHRLSVKGRKWAWHVPRRNRRFYYFPDYDTALQAAIDAVDDVIVNGGTWTWAQWQKHIKENP